MTLATFQPKMCSLSPVRTSHPHETGTFPLTYCYRLVGSNLASNPKFPMHPAKPVDHEYKILYDTSLAINVSTGAFAPVAFVEGTNATMGPGMTTWGFYTPYGIFIWYNITQAYEDEAKLSAATPTPTSVAGAEKRAPDLSVHLMGFQWEPVEGYPNVKQLFWNQTQFDEARQPGFVAKSGAAQNADFGMCHGDYSPRILSE